LSKNIDTTILIPSYNEGPIIQSLINYWEDFCIKNDINILIINDGSTDNTLDILQKYDSKSSPINFVNHKLNKGYGAALKTGIKLVETKYVVTMDADGQHIIEDILKLREKIISSNADLVVGIRDLSNDSFYRKLGKKLINIILKILLPSINISDLNSGMKIYETNNVKKYISLCPNGMSFSDVITLIYLIMKQLVVEEKISIQKRSQGKSKVSTKNAFKTVWKIMLTVMIFHPIRIFFPISLALLIIGLSWSIKFLFEDLGFTVGGSILIISGILIMVLGLISDKISLILKKDL
jgi:glycosyltransferase involved in cell wall biosynthesis